MCDIVIWIPTSIKTDIMNYIYCNGLIWHSPAGILGSEAVPRGNALIRNPPNLRSHEGIA